MRIGIDFDGVLFNTEAFKQFLNTELPGYLDTYRDAFNTVYDPEKHAALLNISVDTLYDTVTDAEQFLYPDADVLQRFQEHGTVVIVSAGPETFQRKKITGSGVTQYVDTVIITGDTPKDQYSIDVLIDDSATEIERVSIPTFHFNREEHGLQDALQWVKQVAAERNL